METFKTFAEWLAERPDDQKQQDITTTVANTLDDMAPDKAMGAIQGTDQQSQKNLVAGTLRKGKGKVDGFDKLAPVVGIKMKNPLDIKMMRKK